MATRRLIDTVPAHYLERNPRHQEIEGELLPALPEDVRPPAPLIRITLPDREDIAGAQYETRKAQRAVSMEADVRVPLAQTVITAALLGSSAGLLALAAGWSWRVPVITSAAALVIVWFWRLRLTDALLWAIENVTQRDLDRDGKVGRPLRSYTVANPGQARTTAARAQRSAEAEEHRAELTRFVRTCYQAGTSEAAHGIDAGGPGRDAYIAARDLLVSLGVAAWRNPERPRSGWRMTVSEAEALSIVSNHLL